MQTIIEDVIFDDDGFYGELISRSWKGELKDDSYFKDVCGSVLKKRLEAC